MRILVTGGAGFIGSHLIADLQNDGFLTMGLDNYNDLLYDPSMKEDRVAFMDIGVQRVDMTHFPSLDDAFSIVKPNIVIHLGALAGVRDSFGKERDYIKNNIDATQNLIDCCKMYNVSRVLYASSSSVYAGSPLPFREDRVTGDQLNPYAYTKRCNEMMFKSSGLDTVGMRFFTVYGDWGRPDMALMSFTHNIAKGLPIKAYNNGRNEKRLHTHIRYYLQVLKPFCSTKLQKVRYIISAGESQLNYLTLLNVSVTTWDANPSLTLSRNTLPISLTLTAI